MPRRVRTISASPAIRITFPVMPGLGKTVFPKLATILADGSAAIGVSVPGMTGLSAIGAASIAAGLSFSRSLMRAAGFTETLAPVGDEVAELNSLDCAVLPLLSSDGAGEGGALVAALAGFAASGDRVAVVGAAAAGLV